MLVLSLIFTAAIVAAAIIQLVVARYFRRRLRRLHSLRSSATTGHAMVVMSVRGCDPSLSNALIGLLNQDYQDFEVRLIVDHRSDRAWNMVHEIQRRHDVESRLSIREMKNPLETCGLKCSALLEALSDIDSKTQYVVLVDADVTPHKRWLSSVLAPLGDAEIGIVTGNQWFEPTASASIGTWLRSLWNAGALVPTVIYENPWAGTCAMRVSDIRRSDLMDRWRNSVVDDGPIRAAFQPLGLKTCFVPSLIMVNREQCTFGYVSRYVTRMLTWSRVYESTFKNTAVHALITFLLMGGIAGALVVSAINGAWLAFVIAGCGIALSCVLTAIAYLVVRGSVISVCRDRGDTFTGMGVADFLKLCALSPLAQLIYVTSCCRAIFARRVQWRQITYEVTGKSQVKMLRYQPLTGEPNNLSI